MKIMSGNLLSDVYDTQIILITYIAYKANKTGGRNNIIVQYVGPLPTFKWSYHVLFKGKSFLLLL